MSDWAPQIDPDSGADPERLIVLATLFMDVEDRLFPRQPTFLQRNAEALRLSGAAVLGCLAAAISSFGVYIVLTLILHFQPT